MKLSQKHHEPKNQTRHNFLALLNDAETEAADRPAQTTNASALRLEQSTTQN
jgi:hypothetical protein